MLDILRLSAISTLVVVLAVLPGCSKAPEPKPAGPPAARVGSQEIPVQLIDQLVTRATQGTANPQAIQTLRRELLEKLIDQQLTADQAMANKLDRSPEVAAQFEAARREVLSRAYLQSVISAVPKPSADEVRQYYLNHPALFAERRIFNLQEIVVPSADKDVAAQIDAQWRVGKSLDEMAQWLQSHQVKFGRGAARRAAEQVPLELLDRIHTLRDGQITRISTRQGFTVLKVVSSEAAPLAEAAALPRVEQFLVNQRGAAAIKQNLQDLRAKAGVTYLGEYARPTPEPAASAAAATATGVPGGVAGSSEAGK